LDRGDIAAAQRFSQILSPDAPPTFEKSRLTGTEVIARLRETLRHEVPGIILTGDISVETSHEAARLGCTLLTKPAKAEELIELIQRLIARPSGTDVAGVAVGSNRPADNAQVPSVFVLEDDDTLRETMHILLQSTGELVESFADAEAFLAAYRPGQTGCLVIDARLPGLSGVALLEQLKTEGSQLPALMLTGYADVTTAIRAMKAGAVGFIGKPIRSDELLAKVQRVLHQQRNSLERSADQRTAASHINTLTARERQVMDLVVAGLSNKEIAVRLGLHQRTVENHRAKVMAKTGATSLPRLVRLAFMTTTTGNVPTDSYTVPPDPS
jgi:two-component system, chemotaxis family, CheB/CheR fusion protein